MEGLPTQKHQNIPDSEMADMGLSPVTQEEMDAAIKALDLSEEDPAKIPEAEKIDAAGLASSPVTEKEMQEAVEAIDDFKEPTPIGDTFEKAPLEEGKILLEDHAESGPEGISNKLSDADKIEALLKQLQDIPPDIKQANDKPEEGPGHIGWTETKYKKCEKCKGSGRWFLFIRCPVCLGKGQIAKTMIFPDGKTLNLTNE